MEVGDFVCETWRDGGDDGRLRPLPRPVWRITEFRGPAVLVEVVGGDGAGITSLGELRVATDEEIARAQVAS